MNRNAFKVLMMLVVLVAAFATTALAQGGSSRLAYVNGSGQLVIINANGDARWIITNPGEQLSSTVDLEWSPNGGQLFFAVQQGGQSELRLADAGNQTVTTLVSLNGVSGGAWAPDGSSIVVGTSDGLVRLDLNARQAEVVVPGGQFINGDVVAPSGNAIFFFQNGSFAVRSQNGTITALPGRNNAGATNVGLWAPRQPFVAYWAFNDRGNATVNVTNANTTETVIIDSQSAVPVTPLAWVPGSTQLLYRSAMGVMAVDVGCLQSGCGSAPAPLQILPVTAGNLAASGGALFYSDANVVYSVDSACVSAGDCTQGRVQLGPIAGNTVAMAALNAAAFTADDGTVQVVSDLGCTQSGDCPLTATGLNGTVFSMAPGGNHLLVDTRDALQIVDVQSGNVAATLNGLNRGAPSAWSN